jgi:hypothetical protein
MSKILLPQSVIDADEKQSRQQREEERRLEIERQCYRRMAVVSAIVRNEGWELFRKIMLWRGGGSVRQRNQEACELADLIYDTTGVEFEQLT